MEQEIRIAAVQSDPKILEKERNVEMSCDQMRTAAREGAQLIVFPECSLTGCCFSSLEEAAQMAEPIPGPGTEILAAVCKELDVYAAVGLLEYGEGDKVYNASALLGPEGRVGKYRKIHPGGLVDDFLPSGAEPFAVHQTRLGQVGMTICKDVTYPESTRILALLAAELIVTLSNRSAVIWQELINVRALENHVNYAIANRVGTERGYTFCGRSKIVDYGGRTLAEASPDREEIIYAEVDMAGAMRDNGRLTGRKPEFYDPIAFTTSMSDVMYPTA